MDYLVLKIAVGLFILAAGFGLVALLKILKGKHAKKSVALTHGAIATAGLVLVVWYAFRHQHHAPITSLVLFLIAALGGLTLFAYDRGKKKIPKELALAHPLIAITALITLIFFIPW